MHKDKEKGSSYAAQKQNQEGKGRRPEKPKEVWEPKKTNTVRSASLAAVPLQGGRRRENDPCQPKERAKTHCAEKDEGRDSGPLVRV